MEAKQILQQLQPIFRDVLDNPRLELRASDSAVEVEGWDSLAHIQIVAAVERQFRVRFSLGELEELKNAGEMAALVGRKLGTRAEL